MELLTTVDCVKIILHTAKREPTMNVFEFLRRLELDDPSEHIKNPEDIKKMKIAVQYAKLMVETIGLEEAYRLLG